jgi:hypothetical protein
MGFVDIAKICGTLRLRSKMLLLLAITLIGALLITLVVFQTLGRVRIGSESYRKISLLRDSLEGSILLKSNIYRLRSELLDLSGDAGNEKIKAGMATVTSNQLKHSGRILCTIQQHFLPGDERIPDGSPKILERTGDCHSGRDHSRRSEGRPGTNT